MERIEVGVLGATGSVGQRLIQLLENHPYFKLTNLAASEKSVGKKYGEVMREKWFVSDKIPEYAKNLVIKECKPNFDCRIVFSALDSSIAAEIEKSFLEKGYIIISNSSNFRMENDIPLIIPEVNAEHIKLVEGKSSFIIKNPNCSATGLVLALAPLHKKFKIKRIFVTTMQALSGAGYPGVSSIDIIDNIIPYISNEEEKIELEPLKILGNFKKGKIEFADIKITAHCNRVNVLDGHLESVSFELEKKVSIEEIKREMINFNPLKDLNLPTSPKQPIIFLDEVNRPQPRLDRDIEKGMSCVVGRLRKCNVLDYKLTILSNNSIRGAAGGALLNAELLYRKGVLK
ncbi:MAG: aspartate-semialdehyde dehydrogenase [Candidatus Pacearchaeota archaeon]